MENKHVKKMPKFLVIREMDINIIMRYFYTSKIAKIKILAILSGVESMHTWNSHILVVNVEVFGSL
jgi:hypothetical protein